MKTPDELMPALSLDDLGLHRWQPVNGAAAELLTPSTTTDRKRRKILRAIESNAGLSDRQIAEIAGVDHKTVAKYRRSGGEIPNDDGEIPAPEPRDSRT